jgi:3-isopropylmalate/(R)-2-methylmalate dehydratase large subunit
MTGMTLIEKIIARAAGKSSVSPGEVVFVAPDLLILYDWFGLSDWYMDTLETELHIDNLPHPEKILFFIDHLIPVQGEPQRALHAKTRNWCDRHGVKYIEGEGIGHSVIVEDGLVVPGMLAAHFDTHVSTIGAIGALGFGIMKDLLAPMATGKMWLQVPGTTKITVEGTFQNGVMGRDFLHRLVEDLGPDGCINRVVEFTGPGIANIGVESRMTICDLANFFGAQTALFAADEKTIDYLSEIEPALIAPPTISNAMPLRDALGTPVSTGIIGTCASGRMEDLRIAARILKHRKVKKGFSLYVIPSSRRTFLKANSEGYINSLVDAGAFMSSPTCDFCFGKAVSLGSGERAISTQTLNVPGRLGSTEAEIYLASSAAVAASAVEGAIVDPRDYL